MSNVRDWHPASQNAATHFIATLDVNRWVVMILINLLFFLIARALDPLTIAACSRSGRGCG